MPQKCPQCGASLPNGVLAGLCPACLLQQGATADTATRPEAKPFVPLTVEEVARLFPQLEILGFLGKGGMGAVYKARQPALDRLVALKILPAQTAPDPGFAERFTREARALARLNHPNIVAVHEFGQVSQSSAGVPPEAKPAAGETPAPLAPPALPYFIMEFVDGVNLRQLQKAGRLSPREALQIVPQICDALQYAHDEGVVHRDIKPENVLVDRKGRVKIADFGLAKIIAGRADSPLPAADSESEAGAQGTARPTAPAHLTEVGQVMGTPHYMAPEQVEHPQDVDHRADIYSLGVVFYEMLTGELPLGKFQPPSRKVQLDVRLDEVVLHALEKEPDRRYQHAGEVKTAIETIAQSPSRPVSSATLPQRNRGLDYRTKTMLFGLPLLHVTSGIDPATGRARVAKGIIAIGGIARGVVAFGGVAMGVFAIGGLAMGAFAYGGLALGLLALGGGGLALVAALAGGAIAPIAVGGGVIGYYAHGGLGIGVHVLDAVTRDPAAQSFFLPWAQTLVRHFQLINGIIVAVVLPIGVGLPLWLQWRVARADADTETKRHGGRTSRFAALVILAVVIVSCVIAVLALRPAFSKRGPAPELWSPSLAPGLKPNPFHVRDEANELRDKGQYQAALDRYRWYWNHALEFNSGLFGVRLSFLLSDWAELARRYPAAKQVLLDIRAQDTEAFLEGRGSFALFMEVSSINHYLQDDEATYELFKNVRKQDPALARQCYFAAEPLLLKHGDYALCLETLGDAENAFNRIRQSWQTTKQHEKRMEELSGRTARPEGSFRPPAPPKTADRTFVAQTCQLILILVKTDHKTQAEHVRDQALELLDDPRLKSAVSDAEQGPARR